MRRLTACIIFANSHFPPIIRLFCSRTPGFELPQSSCVSNSDKKDSPPTLDSGVFSLSPLFPTANARLEECRIEVVGSEAWKVSSGLAEAWRGRGNVDKWSKVKKPFLSDEEETVKYAQHPNKEEDLDFDEIEEMRIRRNLFYKLDKGSKEYEEYKFDFHGTNRNKCNKKVNARQMEKANIASPSGSEKSFKCMEKCKEKLGNESRLVVERSLRFDKNNVLVSWLHEFEASAAVAKTKRSQTFNQVTAPYHEPFCLDIYVSKGSARASVIHRATSKVVAVAHSISKDMKFELTSTKNRAACAAVGEVLAQRALADDIHNVVYTPRKGERLEGKLQIVLEAIIDGGIDVKVKLKQRKIKKASILPPKP